MAPARTMVSSLSMTNVRTVCLESYLQETIEAVENNSGTMRINESHRKTMMRTLLGIRRMEMDKQLRTLQNRLAWKKAEYFVNEHLLSLKVDAQEAPQFSSGLESMIDFRKRPDANVWKFFSLLARGRTYQGKLERLLQDVQPELVPIYLEQVIAKTPETDLLQFYAREQDPQLLELLQKCIDLQLPKEPCQPDDGGRSSGKKGELDLQFYLNTILINDQKVVSPVLIQTTQSFVKSNNKNKRAPYALLVPPTVDLHGMTSELDALVIQQHHHDKGIHVSQVWEAKATLHPTTIRDVLTKKQAAILTLKEARSTELVIEGCRSFCHGDFRLGIFGNTLLNPIAGARRAMQACGERLLETDADIIPEVLETGQVQIPTSLVLASLESLRTLVQEIQPVLVVADSY